MERHVFCVLASIGLVAAMVLGDCRHAAASRQIHAPPRASGHSLSYDGARMIVRVDHEGEAFLDVVETSTGRSLGLLAHSFTAAAWGENSNVAYAVAKDKQVFRLSLDAEPVRIDKIELTGPEAIPTDEAPTVLLFPSPLAPFLIARTWRPHQRLYRCELKPGSGDGGIHTRCHVLIDDGKGALQWIPSAQGRIAARIVLLRDGQRAFQTLKPTGEWASLFRYTPYYTEFVPIRLVQRDGTIWALSSRERERIALVRLHIGTGREEVFFEHDRYDLTKALVHFDEDGEGTPLLVSYNPGYQVVVHFHDGIEAAYETLYEAVGKPSRIDLVSVDRSTKSAVVAVANPGIHLGWYYLDLENKTFRELSGSSLAPHAPSPSRPVAFPARDGVQLYGYLTLPQGSATPGPAPMVLMLHGGPWTRYFWPASALVPFLASKGYVVLRLNYRGSAGYDGSLLTAGKGTLFGGMQHDVLDAAEWAIANGHATRDRIALFGGSFGGFLTLVMLAHHPERFRAGIAINAITDAVDFWKTDWRRSHHRVLWQEFFDTDTLPEVALAEVSPLNNFDRIIAPVQLIAGSRDRRVPPSHSHEMFHLLKEGGKTVQLVEFESASHAIWSTSRESHIVTSLAAFLEEHLGEPCNLADHPTPCYGSPHP